MNHLNIEELLELTPEEQRRRVNEYYATLSQEEVLLVFFTLLKNEYCREVAKEIFSEEEWAKIENII